jgi:RNA polymerase sigma-70 factor (ECF subfamily)
VEAIAVTDRGQLVAGLIDGRVAEGYRLARAILLDDDEAEDAVQDACLNAWLKRSSLRERDRFDAWFDRILVNGCRDRLRRRKRLREITPTLESRARLAAQAPPTEQSLDMGFEALDADHRVVVLMRFWQDRTIDDIAARLDIPTGTVKSRLHYALRTMRAHLEASDGRP